MNIREHYLETLPLNFSVSSPWFHFTSMQLLHEWEFQLVFSSRPQDLSAYFCQQADVNFKTQIQKVPFLAKYHKYMNQAEKNIDSFLFTEKDHSLRMYFASQYDSLEMYIAHITHIGYFFKVSFIINKFATSKTLLYNIMIL